MSYLHDDQDIPFDLEVPETSRPLESPIPGAEVVLDLRTATRDEWLDARRPGIGASDSAAALGESPYGNAFTLWAEKTGRTPPRSENEAMELGSLLEPLVASVFATRTELSLRKCEHMYRHPAHAWMLATPDYYVTQAGKVTALVQIKCTSEYMADDWAGGPPRHVYLQMQHELIVTGLRDAYAVALIGGNRLVYHHVTLDEDAVDGILDGLADFWSHVESGTPPAITAGDKDALDGMYPSSTGRVIQLPADAESYVYRYRKANAAIADAERERDLAANCLKAMLGDASEGYAGDTRITWRTTDRKSYVVKAATYRKFHIQAPRKS